MPDLFPTLPIQRPPAQIVVGRHALVRCDYCDGTGVLTYHGKHGFEEWREPCGWCNGGGVRMLTGGNDA